MTMSTVSWLGRLVSFGTVRVHSNTIVDCPNYHSFDDGWWATPRVEVVDFPLSASCSLCAMFANSNSTLCQSGCPTCTRCLFRNMLGAPICSSFTVCIGSTITLFTDLAMYNGTQPCTHIAGTLRFNQLANFKETELNVCIIAHLFF